MLKDSGAKLRMTPGFRNKEKTPVGSCSFLFYIFLQFGSNNGSVPKICFLGPPKVVEKQSMEKREEREKEPKLVYTMDSELHHGWWTQST